MKTKAAAEDFQVNKRPKTKQSIKFNTKRKRKRKRKKTSVVLISTNDFNRFIVCLKSLNNA